MAFIVRTSARPIAPDPARKVLRAADYAALRRAEELIAEAEARAAAIAEEAKAAYEAERQRGYEDGREEARIEAAETMIENAGRTIDYFSKVEGKMVDLVLAAVRKIFDEFDDRDRVILVVKNALAAVRNQKQMTLRVSPANVDAVRARVNELLAAFPGIGYLDITGDPRLGADACILESEIGIVEASIEGQIGALKNAFAKILGARA